MTGAKCSVNAQTGSLAAVIIAGHIAAHCRGKRQAQSSQSKILKNDQLRDDIG